MTASFRESEQPSTTKEMFSTVKSLLRWNPLNTFHHVAHSHKWQNYVYEVSVFCRWSIWQLPAEKYQSFHRKTSHIRISLFKARIKAVMFTLLLYNPALMLKYFIDKTKIKLQAILQKSKCVAFLNCYISFLLSGMCNKVNKQIKYLINYIIKLDMQMICNFYPIRKKVLGCAFSLECIVSLSLSLLPNLHSLVVQTW